MEISAFFLLPEANAYSARWIIIEELDPGLFKRGSDPHHGRNIAHDRTAALFNAVNSGRRHL